MSGRSSEAASFGCIAQPGAATRSATVCFRPRCLDSAGSSARSSGVKAAASSGSGRASSQRRKPGMGDSVAKIFNLGNSRDRRSEEHTSELQSLMRISYAVFCLNKKNQKQKQTQHIHDTQAQM